MTNRLRRFPLPDPTPRLLNVSRRMVMLPLKSTCTGLRFRDTRKANSLKSKDRSLDFLGLARAIRQKDRTLTQIPMLRMWLWKTSRLHHPPPVLCPMANGSKPTGLRGLLAGLQCSISSPPTCWAPTLYLGLWLRWAMDPVFLCIQSLVHWQAIPAGRYVL